MIARGITASVLIQQLEALIRLHGDREVFVGGGDYPAGVRGAELQDDRDNPYVPEGTIYIQ